MKQRSIGAERVIIHQLFIEVVVEVGQAEPGDDPQDKQNRVLVQDVDPIPDLNQNRSS